MSKMGKKMRTKRIANVKKLIADFFSSMHYFKCGNKFSLKNKQLLKKNAIIPYILFFSSKYLYEMGVENTQNGENDS